MFSVESETIYKLRVVFKGFWCIESPFRFLNLSIFKLFYLLLLVWMFAVWTCWFYSVKPIGNTQRSETCGWSLHVRFSHQEDSAIGTRRAFCPTLPPPPQSWHANLSIPINVIEWIVMFNQNMHLFKYCSKYSTGFPGRIDNFLSPVL